MLSSNLKKLFDNGIQCPIDSLITVSKKAIQKASEPLMILVEINFFTKLQEPRKLHPKIIQKQKKKKYLEKNI